MKTRVGYAGGTKKNPTYHSLGDHTETIQIDFDPDEISYEKLLGVFWADHDPQMRSWSQQYKTAVFYHNEEQKRLATETRDSLAAGMKGEIFTEIIPFSEFYFAEDYHQKYRLRHEHELMKVLDALYPDPVDFANSTVAARLNGYLNGFGSFEDLQTEINDLGLHPESSKRLLQILQAQKR